MKKGLFVCSVLFLLLNALRAQNKNDPDFKRFGFRAGANFSHVNFAKGVPPPVVPVETNWKAGINIGFLMMVKIADDLYFQPEYAYSQMGGNVKNSDSAYSFSYFSMPLLLKYQVHEKFSIMVGPQFDLLINAKKTISGNSLNITHDTEERSLAGIAGVEYHLTNSFSICARYMLGLNHIGLGQRSDVQEFKYETAQLLACVRF